MKILSIKRFEFKLLLVTVFAAAILAGCGGAEDRKARYMQRGVELFEAENFEKARLEFKNVLQIDPKDLEARYMLAQIFEKEQDFRQAAGHYLGVLQENPEHTGALAKMGKLYLLSRDQEKTKEHADKLLAKDPNSAAGLVLRAGLSSLQQNYDQAVADAQAALAAEPGNVDATALLSSIYSSQKKFTEAEGVLKDTIALQPENSDLIVLLAQVYLTGEQPEKAESALRELIAKKPQVFAHRQRLINLLTVLERTDDAIVELERAVADIPDEEQPKLAHIEYVARNKGLAEAESVINGYVANDNDAFAMRFALGQLKEQQREWDAAQSVYDEIIGLAEDDGPQELRAKLRKAIVHIRQNDRPAASSLIASVLEVNPRDKQALMLRGSIAHDAGDPVTAIADFRSALRDNPNDAKLLELLANSHLKNNEPELARENMLRAVEAAPGDINVRQRTALLLLRLKRLDEAETQLSSVLGLQPGNEQALQTLFKLHVYNKSWDKARGVADQYKTAHPQKPEGFYFDGLVAQAEGDLEQALVGYESALTVQPQAIQPLSQMIKGMLALGRKDEAKRRLEESIELTPGHFVARNLLGEILAAERQADAAREQFQEASTLQPSWAIPYRNLASIYIQEGQDKRARQVLEDGVEKTKGQALLVTALAGLLERTGELDTAIDNYESVLEKTPNSALAINNLAMLLAEYKQDESSLNRAKELADLLQNERQPAYLDTVGWVKYKTGDYNAALEFLEKAVEAAPDSAVLRYHLGMAYFKSGNEVLAKDNLQQSLAADTKFRGRDEAQKTLESLGG